MARWMDAYLISKQDKVGDYSPIIVWVSGDDYGALIYILLNKENKPTSHFILRGGECGGPGETQDSLMVLCPFKNSFLNNNVISSYVLNVYMKPEQENSPSIIDSITYKTIISQSGQVETRQLDSTRYKRRWYW